MPYECVYMPTVSAFFPWLTATLTGELEAAMNEVAMVQVLRLRTNPWWVHEVEYTKSSVNTSWVLQLYIHPHLEYAAPVWDLHQQGKSYQLPWESAEVCTEDLENLCIWILSHCFFCCTFLSALWVAKYSTQHRQQLATHTISTRSNRNWSAVCTNLIMQKIYCINGCCWCAPPYTFSLLQ